MGIVIIEAWDVGELCSAGMQEGFADLPVDLFQRLDAIGHKRRAHHQQLADALTADFAMDQALETRYGKLSRGQRAMTGIVVGLASGAELLLLDEPYVGLDTHNTQVFYRHLLEQSDTGRTIVMATHHIEDAARILDSALILGRDGRIAAHLTPEDVEAIGRRCVDLLVDRIGGFDGPRRVERLPTAFHHRDSCGCERARAGG